MLGTSQTLNKGRYQIISSFGQNASGGLYQAVDTVNDTPVVLRESVAKFGRVATPSQIEAFNAAFEGEAKVLADIKHESLVSVHDYFSEIDRQYLVLEYVTGDDLTKFLEPGMDRPPISNVLSWADQLLSGLEYLHSISPPIIHSNIKPENLKLTSDRKIKLLTTHVSIDACSNCEANPAFCYEPLEQRWPDLGQMSQREILNGYDELAAGVLLRPLDARSDLYSAAASLYHVLTGTEPCDAFDRTTAILDGEPDPLKKPADINANIPVEVSDAFMRALALRREDRFDSAVIMRQVLRTAVVRAQERSAGVGKKPAVSTSSSNQLDVERTKAEEREREIKAEQERLDEEQKRIEARRLELETERERQAAELERLRLEAENEQKRLEQERHEREAEAERQRVAERLAELEAQREQERAEEERLEREAEAERRRAEEKLQKLKLEQERHRAEQKRIELETRKEIERAEERIKELSVHDLKIEKVIEHEDLAVPQFQEQPGFGWRMPAILGAIAIAVAGGVGGWLFVTDSTNAPTAVTQQGIMSSVEQPRQQVAETAPVTAQAVAETAPVTTQEVPVVAEQPQPPITEATTSEIITSTEPQSSFDRPKRLQTTAIQEKPKKPAPEKPAAPVKKKVTVDDLINDN
jgi:serine/threonine protein kinase